MRHLQPALLEALVKRNTVLLSASQAFYTLVSGVNVFLGALIIEGLTGSRAYAGLGTAIAWGGRVLIVYQSGRLMDRFGRVLVLQLGTILSMAGALTIGVMLLSRSFPGVLLGLVIYGLGVGATQQNRIAVADMYPSKRRGRGIGILMVASVLGAVGLPFYVLVGTVLTSQLGIQSLLDYYAMIWLTSLLLLVPALVLTHLVKPDPKEIGRRIEEQDIVTQARTNEYSSKQSSGTRLVRLSSYPVIAAFIVSGLTQGNMTMNMALVSAVLKDHHVVETVIPVSISSHLIGMYILSVSMGRWTDRYGRRLILILGTIISALGAFMTPYSSEFWTITIGIFLVGVGWSAATVASTALLSDLSGTEQRGRLIGMNDFVLGLAALSFPIVGAVIASVGQFSSMAWFGLLASIPALFAALLLREERPGVYDSLRIGLLAPRTRAVASQRR